MRRRDDYSQDGGRTLLTIPIVPHCLRNKVVEEVTSLAFIEKLVRHLMFAVLQSGFKLESSLLIEKFFRFVFVDLGME